MLYGLVDKYVVTDIPIDVWIDMSRELFPYTHVPPSRIVVGYLGHEERTKESDKVICEFLDEHPDMKEKVNSGFLRNSTGRHYMDNCPSPEELRKFLEEL